MAEIYSDINPAVLRNVPRNTTVLDIGCGTGLLGAKLRKKGCEVYGIEHPASAAIARKRLDQVYTADIEKETPNITKKFDILIFADVLEHLVNPEEVLRKYLKFLKPNGRVIISLPNIANWTIRFKLLFGNLTPTETGILDRTHLHFYTLKTAKQMLLRGGVRSVKVDLTPNFVRSCLGLVKSIAQLFGIKGKEHEVHEQLLNSKAYKFYSNVIMPVETAVARLWKRLFAYQLVFVARKR